ncbi:MAG: hypothetical protein R6U78_10535 [Bacteroidales bacterium]
MDHYSSYRILPEHRLIVSLYAGHISEQEIISLKETIRQDPKFNISYNTLDDFTDVDFHVSKESYMLVFEWLREHYSWERNSAVLTDTPDQVVNISLFNYIQKHSLPMRIRIFSTLEGALNWVSVPVKNAPAIKSVLEELKNREIAS